MLEWAVEIWKIRRTRLIIERTGDTAVALLKAGAETDKKDIDGRLAMELAPDAQVSSSPPPTYLSFRFHPQKSYLTYTRSASTSFEQQKTRAENYNTKT